MLSKVGSEALILVMFTFWMVNISRDTYKNKIFHQLSQEQKIIRVQKRKYSFNFLKNRKLLKHRQAFTMANNMAFQVWENVILTKINTYHRWPHSYAKGGLPGNKVWPPIGGVAGPNTYQKWYFSLLEKSEGNFFLVIRYKQIEKPTSTSWDTVFIKDFINGFARLSFKIS